MPLELTITNEQKVQVTLNPVTATGKPARLDGAPTWAITSGPGTLDVASDGLSAFLISPDEDLSDTVYQVTADADLGSGVVEVADAVTLKTVHALATSLGIKAADPVSK